MPAREQARARARYLVPHQDGYDSADAGSAGPGYVDLADQSAPPRDGTVGRVRVRWRHAGRRSARGQESRGQRNARQRSIRFTITILLIVPLLSLVALWAYAATSTVGGALAKRNADTINHALGEPLQNLIEQLDIERAASFEWQNAHSALPHANLVGLRQRTDADIAQFQAGYAQVRGTAPAGQQPVATVTFAHLAQLPQLRTQVDAGTVTALAAFGDYTATLATFFPFIDSLNNPDESVALSNEAQAVVDEGAATEDLEQEAALVGGAEALGDTMPAQEHQMFDQAVDNQRLLEQLGNSPLDWQQNTDPYASVLGSPAFASFQALENKIVASGPGQRLPVSPLAWQSALGTVTADILQAETNARLGVTAGDARAGDVTIIRLIAVGGAGLVAVIVSSILLLGFGNRISRELTGLRGAARTLAGERLPSVVGRLRAGDEVDVAVEAPPLDLKTRTREVTETADAFSTVQRTAVEAAVDQARLRKGVSLVFRSLARRSQSLVQRQLRLLDQMEHATTDPEALQQLFQLDHLTTRMRRQAEGLIILSGAAAGRTWRQPVPTVDVLRGAISEIEAYARVDLVTDSTDYLKGTAVADVTHILAELIENAAAFSPPSSRVVVQGSRVANGYAVEVTDHGLGIPRDGLAALNERLLRPPEFDLAQSDQLGLFVVSTLAGRHGIQVQLRHSDEGGTTAIVLIPHSVVADEGEVRAAAPPSRSERRPLAPPARAGAGRPPLPRVPVQTAAPGPATGHTAALRPPTVRPATGQPETGQVATVQPADLAVAEPQADADGLPRRLAGANMAPELREDRRPAELTGRSPELARAFMSAVQLGARTGRRAGPPLPPPQPPRPLRALQRGAGTDASMPYGTETR